MKYLRHEKIAAFELSALSKNDNLVTDPHAIFNISIEKTLPSATSDTSAVGLCCRS
jgi:hypothetical protein